MAQVGAKKVSSEEETWSKLSNLIFYNNWKGIYSQLLPFAQLSKNTSLVDSLNPTFEAAFKCLPVVTKDVWSKVSHCADHGSQGNVEAFIELEDLIGAYPRLRRLWPRLAGGGMNTEHHAHG